MIQEKVLIIGLDGSNFDFIKPWVKEGRLPTFGRFLEKGTHGVLLSTHQSNNPQAWTSFMTGKNAGKHGIFDFVEPLPNSYDGRFINASYRSGKTLWGLINDVGGKVGVLNVPMTYPAEEVNGCFISGWDSPGATQPSVYPLGLLQEINETVGTCTPEPGVTGFIYKGMCDLAVSKMYESIENGFQAAKYLLKNKEWDFFTLVFTTIDLVQRYFRKFVNPNNHRYGTEDKEGFGNVIYSVYQKLDKALNDLINEVSEDVTILIMSGHGGRSPGNKIFYINHWLAEQGFLRFTSGFPSVIDWGGTVAYSRENMPTININLKGREPKGTVESGAEYEKVRGGIINKLLHLRCPQTNEPLVNGVLKKEEIYSGKFIDKAPDLLIQWKNDTCIQHPSYTSEKGKWLQILTDKELDWAEMASNPGGIHRRDGIFLALGKHIKQSFQVQDANIVDILPTVLFTMGIPIPEDTDGRILTEIFKEDFIRHNQTKISLQQETTDNVQAQPCAKRDEPNEITYTDSEAALIEERLKGLGYIE